MQLTPRFGLIDCTVQTGDSGVEVAQLGFEFGLNGLWQGLRVWKVSSLGEIGLKVLIDLFLTLEL